MSLLRGSGRGRDWLRFLLAAAWVAVAYFLADRAAHGFTHGAALPLVRDLFEIFLLLIGFSYMEMAWENVRQPIPAMGLGVRPGTGREFALGAALAWGMVVAVFLVIALAGHFYVQLSGSLIAWRLLVLHIFALAAAALAAEIAFRGYPFQKLVRAIGPFAATLIAGAAFALLKLEDPAATPTAMWISGMAAVMLSIGYLRTRRLWLPWGLHFLWLAAVALLFGQPLAGNRQASSVIRSYADGPTWLTGGEYGPAASLIALIVLWIGIVLLFRITRNLQWKQVPSELPLETAYVEIPREIVQPEAHEPDMPEISTGKTEKP